MAQSFFTEMIYRMQVTRFIRTGQRVNQSLHFPQSRGPTEEVLTSPFTILRVSGPWIDPGSILDRSWSFPEYSAPEEKGTTTEQEVHNERNKFSSPSLTITTHFPCSLVHVLKQT